MPTRLCQVSGFAEAVGSGCEGCPGTDVNADVDIDGVAGGDKSGSSVSISDDGLVVAIGAPHSDGDAGHARVFEFDAATQNWTQLGQTINGSSAGALFGGSVSLCGDGTTVAIGARLGSGGGVASGAGEVRVFRFDLSGSTWSELGALGLSGQAELWLF